jgi:hypothetical protein
MKIALLITGLVVVSLTGGCKAPSPATDWKKSRPVGVPAESAFIGFTDPVGQSEILFSPTGFRPRQDGTVWVANTRNGVVIWSGRVNANDRLTIDAATNSIRINGDFVYMERIEDRFEYVIYYKKD